MRIICSSLFILLSTLSVCAQHVYSLDESIRIASENNLLYKAARYNTKLAEADITTAQLRPNLEFNNQALFLANPSQYPALGKNNRQIWYQLTKQFKVAGQRQKQIDFGKATRTFVEKDLAEQKRQLNYDVAGRWLDVWYAQSRYELTVKAKGNLDTLLKINKLRLKNQVITISDNMRTEILADQYELDIMNRVQEGYISRQDLQRVLGAADTVQIDKNDAFLPIEVEDKLDSLLEYAYEHRNDIIAAKAALDMAVANERVQKAVAYPMIEAGAIYNPQNGAPYVGSYLTIPIPVFNRNQGEIQKAAVIKDQTNATINAIKLQIQTEVNTALRAYEVQKSNMKRSQEIMTKADKVLNTVLYSYLKGGTTIVDFLDAQRTWYSTQQMYYEVLYQYRRSYLELIYTTSLITQI